MCLPIPRRPGGSRRAEFEVSCDSEVQVPGHVRINGKAQFARAARQAHTLYTLRPVSQPPWQIEAEEKVMETNKCAHPACNCMVPKGGQFGKYCSEHCKEAGDITELHCDCKHPGCR